MNFYSFHLPWEFVVFWFQLVALFAMTTEFCLQHLSVAPPPFPLCVSVVYCQSLFHTTQIGIFHNSCGPLGCFLASCNQCQSINMTISLTNIDKLLSNWCYQSNYHALLEKNDNVELSPSRSMPTVFGFHFLTLDSMLQTYVLGNNAKLSILSRIWMKMSYSSFSQIPPWWLSYIQVTHAKAPQWHRYYSFIIPHAGYDLITDLWPDLSSSRKRKKQQVEHRKGGEQKGVEFVSCCPGFQSD